ncbi:MAG TPA: hypothetical protein ENN69_05975 [Spirochaetia bacterium]|nr:hypothetical protein [Spirochaetia bacterium]
MDLSVADLVKLLHVNEEELFSMIHEKKLPAYEIDNEIRFNKTELREWLLEHHVKVPAMLMDHAEAGTVSLTTLIGRGGVFANVAGENVFEVIKNAVSYIPLPFELSRDRVIYALLEREEMMPTAVGKGIALPHPREPILTERENQSVSICFLKSPIDFKALDKEPVHTLFVILSADASAHLAILSRISLLCHEEDFLALLKDRKGAKEIIDYIIIKEMEWNSTPNGG